MLYIQQYCYGITDNTKPIGRHVKNHLAPGPNEDRSFMLIAAASKRCLSRQSDFLKFYIIFI